MPVVRANGVELHYDEVGRGEPLVLVHGSWMDGDSWGAVTGRLGERFRVIAYDRRGHSRSEHPGSQGSVEEDVDDLAALIEALHAAPAHVVGNSFGGAIALRLASDRAPLCASLAVHEAPLASLLAADPSLAPLLEEVGARVGAVVEMIERREHEAAARQFVETVAVGPGAWERDLDERTRQAMIVNAPTFADETRDPAALTLDLERLGTYDGRILLTLGSESPPFFVAVERLLASALPHAERHTFDGAGHLPHASHPDVYAARLAEFAGHGVAERPR